MNLDLLLLGLLRDPASGYDLGRHIRDDLSHFWSTDLPQLYRTLNRLASEGLLDVRSEASRRGPRRKVYSTTPAGMARLDAWLRSEPTLGAQRIEYQARVHLLGAIAGNRGAVDALHRLKHMLETELDRVRARTQRDPARIGVPPGEEDAETLFSDLALELSQARLTAEVAWAARAIRHVEERRAADQRVTMNR